MSDDALREIGFIAGCQLAVELAADAARTTSAFESHVNAVLAPLGIGPVRIEVMSDRIDVVHNGSPLPPCPDPLHEPWGKGLFEGLYTEWMRQLGASSLLECRMVDEAEGLASITFRVGGHAMTRSTSWSQYPPTPMSSAS